jgi:hypothetical protein
MATYYIIFLVLGGTLLALSFLPIAIKKLKLSYTLFLLVFGAVLFYLKAPLPWPDPVWPVDLSLRFTELVVIISLMIAGLKIGLNYTWNE